MVSAIKFVIAGLLLYASVPAQEQPRQLKSGGHLLGETAEQFYSEGYMGDLLHACQVKDWKTVSHMSQNAYHSSKNNAKDICAIATLAKQQATSGARQEYKGNGDKETRRADTFTFDRGRLVKIDMVYSATSAEFEGYHPKSFGELFAGLKEAYGAPTKSYTEPAQNAYGVKSDAQRAVWMGKDDIIMLIEQPGADGWTELVAQTLAEYNRAAQAPKTANPLQ